MRFGLRILPSQLFGTPAQTQTDRQQRGATSEQLRGIRATPWRSRKDGAGHVPLQNDKDDNERWVQAAEMEIETATQLAAHSSRVQISVKVK